MKKPIKILLIVLSSVVGAFLLFVIGINLYVRIPTKDYYNNATKEFKIPGIDDDLIPQGLTYDSSNEIFYITGYDKDTNKASSIYAVKDNKEIKHLYIASKDGSVFNGHSGGIVYHGDYLYLAGSSKGFLYVISYDDVINASDGDTVRIIGEFNTPFVNNSDGSSNKIRVSFTASTSTSIFVGEYHKDPGYTTGVQHHYIVDGVDFGGIVLEYEFDDNAEYGIKASPKKAYSIIDLVQGMCFDQDGYMYLSTSAGFALSHIAKYDTTKMNKIDDITIDSVTIPIYALSNNSLVYSITTPPMSEEIEIVDNKMYTMCEFASNKHILGKFTTGDYCYALDITKYNK